MELRHGYTLSDLHQMTVAACRADRLLAMPYYHRRDIAWSAIALALFEAEHWPRRESLIQAGWQAIYRHIRDGLRERGYQDGIEWASGAPTMPRFVRFWGAGVTGSHEGGGGGRGAVGEGIDWESGVEGKRGDLRGRRL